MRSLASITALSLATFQCISALNLALLRKFSDLAEEGLYPDGSPITIPPSEQSFRTLQTNTLPVRDEVIKAEYIELPLDHFAENEDFAEEGTFWNRYWVSEAAYRPGGPVFLYDVGEADAGRNWDFRLRDETSFFRQMVEKFGGIGIVWEHRYYGNSTPGPIDINTPPEVFKRLSTDQSLADIDRFAKQFSRRNIKQTLTPDKTPWVMVGGSYPAMRVAFMRDRYPETIYAGFASSAPVEARIDMSSYWEPIVRGMRSYGFGNCTRDANAAIKYIDSQLDRPATAEAIKKQFLGLGAEKNENGPFAEALANTFGGWQSYGIDGKPWSIRSFCDWISTDPATNRTAPAEGWARTKGAKWAADRWASWPSMTAMVNGYMDTGCSGSPRVEGSCELAYRQRDPAGIAWTWQFCTEWGFFQSANFGPNQIVSKYNSIQHLSKICRSQFPAAPSSLLPAYPTVSTTNSKFGGWNLRPSHIYWSGGEFDPWRTLSPLSAEPFAPKPRTSTNPPGCEVELEEGKIFGYVMRGAQHCYDFRTYFQGGEVSRGYFYEALRGWLACFGKKKGRGGGKGGKKDDRRSVGQSWMA